MFVYLWLCWVFISVRGPSPVVASGGHSSSRCAGLSPSRPLPLRSTGCRRAGSAIVAHGPSCSAACGILPDQGSNPCPLHWQADSQPLRHQGSPGRQILNKKFKISEKCQDRCIGTSLVAQWLRIHLPMQGTRVQALVREDPTCRGATKPVRHNYWACALEPASHNYLARMPQLLKSARLEPVLRNKRSHCNEKPAHHNEE